MTLLIPEATDLRVPPRLVAVPPRISSAGAEVADFAKAFGRPPDAEQRFALDVLCSETRGGKWAALDQGILEARQNGKTGAVILPNAMYDLWELKRELVVWTAHEVKTADKTFADLKRIIAGNSWLSRKVARIWEGAGNKAIELTTGARMEFHARTGSAGRGFSGDTVVFDEAQELQADSLGALVPTLSTRPNPRVLYAGSAAKVKSVNWHELRKRAEMGMRTVAWVEWSAERRDCRLPMCSHFPGTPGCSLDDPELQQQANHTLGVRIPWSFMESERNSMPPEEFMREILAWGEAGVGEAPLTADMWAKGVDPYSRSIGRPALGIDASPSLRSVAILGATWRPHDGRRHLEVVEYRAGADWLVDRVVKLRKKHKAIVVMARSSPAIGLLPDLLKAHVPVELLSDAELAAGGAVLEATFKRDDPDVRHPGDDIITRALRGATSAPYSDGGWKWVRKDSSADICPVVAMTVADIGLRKFVRFKSGDPNKRGFG